VPWRKPKEVHVHTRAELAAALRGAERIVVEGDETLTAFAAHMAHVELPEFTAPEGRRLRPLGEAERSAHAPRTSSSPRLWPWVAGAAVFAGGAAAAVWLEHFSTASARAGAVAAAPAQNPILLAWLAAAVGVLLALFFVARRVTADQADARGFWRLESPPPPLGRHLILARVPRRVV
jgi:hypothetical protein